MALLEKLKSLLGVGGEGSNRRDRDGGVTVEAEPAERTGREAPPPMSSRDHDVSVDDATREPSSSPPESATNSASESTADGAAEDDGPKNTTADDEPETVADAIEEAEPKTANEPLIEEAEPDDEADEAAAAQTDANGLTETISQVPDDDDGAAEPGAAVGPDETDTAPTTEKTADSEPEPTEVESEPVTEIKGIGPAYGDRLADAGVDSTLALAEGDAEDLAEQTDIAASRIEEWIDRANNR